MDVQTEPVEQLREIHSWCFECREWCVGESYETRALDGEHESWTKEEDIDWLNVLVTPCCTTDIDELERDWKTMINVKPWQCTSCETLHKDFPAAIQCCI